jgi:hypothetical protein
VKRAPSRTEPEGDPIRRSTPSFYSYRMVLSNLKLDGCMLKVLAIARTYGTSQSNEGRFYARVARRWNAFGLVSARGARFGAAARGLRDVGAHGACHLHDRSV